MPSIHLEHHMGQITYERKPSQQKSPYMSWSAGIATVPGYIGKGVSAGRPGYGRNSP